MKDILSIAWAIIVALAILGLVFYISLWFVWAKVISPEIGFFIAAMVALVYFYRRLVNILEEKKE